MTQQEEAIWAAAYGAAFVADFERTRYVAEALPRGQRSPNEMPSETAERVTNAEGPGYIADLAVRRYREWQKAENPTFGLLVMDP